MYRKNTVPFIDKGKMIDWLKDAKNASNSQINAILDKAATFEGLTHKEVAVLLTMKSQEQEKKLFKIARHIKEQIYGQRIVMFAPLYVSDFCVNNCTYCGYQNSHDFRRKILNQKEIAEETKAVIDLGHKRIALEAGEDDKKASIEYILQSIKTIYETKTDSGEIRRVNVNIAATTVENYKKLKTAGIGTYILFQETYDPDSYDQYHLDGPKSDYFWHTMAFDRAQQAGIDDVGGGVLFGLSDPAFEVLALMLHQEYLEEKYGVGFHTISVPRIRPAPGSKNKNYPYAPDDEYFKRLVAIIRLAVPYTGIIVSTRESASMRKDLIDCGVTQMSADSAVGVGGYRVNRLNKEESTAQFSRCDERSTSQVIEWMLEEKLIPSYCTACYRKCRTGDRFMQLAKSGQIKNVCQPNALATLTEYLLDYGDENLQKKGFELIEAEINAIKRSDIREITKKTYLKIKNGERDIFL